MEVHIARLAARRASRKAIVAIESHIATMEKAASVGNMEDHVKADIAFHFAIADASENLLLGQFLTLIRNLMKQWVSASLGVVGVAEEALMQHREILEAIRSKKNEDLAGEAMARHLEAMGNRLLASKKASPRSQ